MKASLGVRLLAGATLLAAVTGLALVSGGRAGSVGATFDVSVQPAFLTAGGKGFVKAEFAAASGPGTGTATHVVMTIDLPDALLDPSSSNCVESTSAPAGFSRFKCDIGTVKAGNTVKRFITFSAPPTAAAFTVNGSIVFDMGSGGAGGGGKNQSLSDSGGTTVVAVGDETRAGSCTGSASTPPVSHHDAQSTSVSGASAAPALGLPCTWVFVGEDDAPEGSGILTDISFLGLPVTNAPATLVITFATLPAPLSSLTLFYLPNYPDGPDPLQKAPMAACVDGALPPNQTACLLSLEALGEGAKATILIMGTGGDPGTGMGGPG